MEKFLGRGSDDSKVRKTEFLDILIHHGSDNAYKAAAYFEKGYGYEEAERIIFEEIGGVKDRQDCSDFHFTIILYIYYRFYDRLSQQLRQVIEETALGYRYWIDEPGDDVMWFLVRIMHCCSIHVSTWQESYSRTDCLSTAVSTVKKFADMEGRC